MSDTPETDAAIKDQSKWMRPFVSTTLDGITYDSPVASLCRKLERERDDARNIVEKLTEQGLAMMDENRSLKREIKKLKKKYE